MDKSHVVSCRVDDDEFNNISTVANQLDMNKSTVLKLALDDDLGKYRPIKLSPAEKRSLDKNRRKAVELLAKLSSKVSSLSSNWLHAGNNLNQIAHYLNKNKDDVPDFSLDDDVDNLLKQLSAKKLISQNTLLIRRLTRIWQLLMLRIR